MAQPDGHEREFHRVWRERPGERPKRLKFTTVDRLTPWDRTGRDLDIIIAPLDGRFPGREEEYTALVNLYNIPDAFVGERERSVTHSFGRQLVNDELETLWMHFLVEIPSRDSPDRQPTWLKWGFVLTWLPKAPTQEAGSGENFPRNNIAYSVTLIAFQPPIEALGRLMDFVLSPSWTDVTVDPFKLVDIALASWYERIDKIAWDVTNLIRADEEEIFNRARMLRPNMAITNTDLDLHRIHTSAKDAIFMLEALDTAIRSVDMALSAHMALPGSQAREGMWENTHRLLRHRSELFHSTRLRTLSSQERIRNTVDLAFHINTAHDSRVNLDNSRVNLENSRSVRIISLVGMVFIPFSTITSVFGTQFFTSAPDGDGATAAKHMHVSPDFWIMWAIAVPVTVIIVGLWRATEQGTNITLHQLLRSCRLCLENFNWRWPSWTTRRSSTSRGDHESVLVGALAAGMELQEMRGRANGEHAA